jgi:hypothetical protein
MHDPLGKVTRFAALVQFFGCELYCLVVIGLVNRAALLALDLERKPRDLGALGGLYSPRHRISSLMSWSKPSTTSQRPGGRRRAQ